MYFSSRRRETNLIFVNEKTTTQQKYAALGNVPLETRARFVYREIRRWLAHVFNRNPAKYWKLAFLYAETDGKPTEENFFSSTDKQRVYERVENRFRLPRDSRTLGWQLVKCVLSEISPGLSVCARKLFKERGNRTKGFRSYGIRRHLWLWAVILYTYATWTTGTRLLCGAVVCRLNLRPDGRIKVRCKCKRCLD